MYSTTVHQAKTNLSKLLQDVEAGEEVIISRGSVPVAKLIPFHIKEKRVPGTAKGKIILKKGFEEPLPEEVIQEFEK